MLFITFPQGRSSWKTAMAEQRASSHHAVCVPLPPPSSSSPSSPSLVTPPLEKSTKRPLCESTETWVILLYIMVFSHCHTTAHTHTLLPHTHTQSGTSRGGSFSPLTFSEPLGPWHYAQTTQCTARAISPGVHVSTQTRHGDDTRWRNMKRIGFVASSHGVTPPRHKRHLKGDILDVPKREATWQKSAVISLISLPQF